MSAVATVRTASAAAIAPGQTLTLSYPSGFAQADLLGTTGGNLVVNDNDVFPQAASGAGTVLFTFNAGNITVTNNSGITWPAGAAIIAGFASSDFRGSYNNYVKQSPPPQTITNTFGTAGQLAIADVTASPTQAAINNNFRVCTDQINAIAALLKKAGMSL